MESDTIHDSVSTLAKRTNDSYLEHGSRLHRPVACLLGFRHRPSHRQHTCHGRLPRIQIPSRLDIRVADSEMKKDDGIVGESRKAKGSETFDIRYRRTGSEKGFVFFVF